MSSYVVTQSIGVEYSRQGVEIKSFSEVYNTMLPRFLSNSTPKTTINGEIVSFGSIFDESNSTNIASNKKDSIPNHEMEKRDFGYPKSFKDSTAFEDYAAASAVEYLVMQGDITTGYQLIDLLYPYVLDTPGQIGPGTYDGVIEPFGIRSQATLESTDRPFSARRVRGGISDSHEDQFGRCTLIDQKKFITMGETRTRPYIEYGDEYNELIDQKFGYFANEPDVEDPFFEKTKEDFFSQIVGKELTEALMQSDSAFDEVGKDYISSTSGYTFIDHENGTDSIAFMDQKGI
jgi:hypothetical protein